MGVCIYDSSFLLAIIRPEENGVEEPLKRPNGIVAGESTTDKAEPKLALATEIAAERKLELSSLQLVV